MEKYYIIDRIEGDKVVLEGFYNNMIVVDKSIIVDKVKEGDLLVKRENLYYYDKEATIKRKEVINNITKGIWK